MITGWPWPTRLAGIRGGADCIHTTVNGMGERTGIPDLCETVLALRNLMGMDKYDLHGLTEISAYLERVDGLLHGAQQTGDRYRMPSRINPACTPTGF